MESETYKGKSFVDYINENLNREHRIYVGSDRCNNINLLVGK